MKYAQLIRDTEGDDGTFGQLYLSGVGTVQTGELPWRNNAPDFSRIPIGTYVLHQFDSPRLGLVLRFQNVPGRTLVDLHRGNWCGDTLKGYRSDVEGCVIVGTARGVLLGQMAVQDSEAAMETVLKWLTNDDLTLTVAEAFDA
jgi:hypothetical protein